MQRRLLISVIAFLAMTSPAVAQDPVQDAYGGSGVKGEVIAPSGGSGTPDAGTGGAGTGAGTGSANPAGDGVASRAVTPPAPARSVTPAPGRQLPFTGFDIALLVLGGGVLLALGFGLRRASRDIAV
jgi:hypothetical protein